MLSGLFIFVGCIVTGIAVIGWAIVLWDLFIFLVVSFSLHVMDTFTDRCAFSMSDPNNSDTAFPCGHFVPFKSQQQLPNVPPSPVFLPTMLDPLIMNDENGQPFDGISGIYSRFFAGYNRKMLTGTIFCSPQRRRTQLTRFFRIFSDSDFYKVETDREDAKRNKEVMYTAVPVILEIISLLSEQQTVSFGTAFLDYMSEKYVSYDTGESLINFLKKAMAYEDFWGAQVYITGLIYMLRLSDMMALTHESGHRMGLIIKRSNVYMIYLACCVVASKTLEDVVYDNNSVSRLSGVPILVLNSLEVNLLMRMQFNVTINDLEFNQCTRLFKRVMMASVDNFRTFVPIPDTELQ